MKNKNSAKITYSKTLNDLWSEYCDRYDGKPKHNYVRFITVMAAFEYHRTYIKPKIDWWHKSKN